jgi:hypothetical protein
MKQTNTNIRLENHADGTTIRSSHRRKILSLNAGKTSCGEQNWTDMDQGLTAGFSGDSGKTSRCWKIVL